MADRIIQIKNQQEARELFEKIGAYKSSFNIMAPKTIGRVLYLKDAACGICNILKQEMLSLGGDAAVSKGIISGKDKKSDCLIFGSLAQIKKLIFKLRRQPAVFSEISPRVERLIRSYEKSKFEFRCCDFKLNLSRRTFIMGILNVTPDSFSDGGKYFNEEDALRRGLELEKEGADIIDIGGQSTRPGAKEISCEEEKKRIVRIIKSLCQRVKIPISVDTYKYEVAQAALGAGASIINDVYGLRKDVRLAKLAVEFRAGVVLMHMKGTPRTMQRNPCYKDLMGEIINFLSETVELAVLAGINEKSIMVDPGIGFGKTVKDNFVIIKKLAELKSLGKPILIGPSRKSFIGEILKVPADERLYGTMASVSASVLAGANVIRAHDVDCVKQAVKITDAVLRS